MTSVVTSFSEAGWNKYGKRCVETFDQHWHPSVHLIVVTEDAITVPPSSRGRTITQLDLNALPSAEEFLAKMAPCLWAHGNSDAVRSGPHSETITRAYLPDRGYNFRFDAYKFCKKVFAIKMASLHAKERLFWLDADTVTHTDPPLDLLDHMLPPQFDLSCLQRANYHSECGFVGYRLDSVRTLDFIERFAWLYSSGEVFGLQEWHDSWVFDYLRKQLGIQTYAIPNKSRHHPFINSELGRYMDHMKGERKRYGRSQAVEQRAHRDIPYWKRQK